MSLQVPTCVPPASWETDLTSACVGCREWRRRRHAEHHDQARDDDNPVKEKVEHDSQILPVRRPKEHLRRRGKCLQPNFLRC